MAGGKLRYVPLHPVAAERIHAYLEASSHHLTQTRAPLFKPLRGQQTGAGITANGTHALVGQYAKVAGIEVIGLGVHGFMLMQRLMPWSTTSEPPDRKTRRHIKCGIRRRRPAGAVAVGMG